MNCSWGCLALVLSAWCQKWAEVSQTRGKPFLSFKNAAPSSHPNSNVKFIAKLIERNRDVLCPLSFLTRTVNTDISLLDCFFFFFPSKKVLPGILWNGLEEIAHEISGSKQNVKGLYHVWVKWALSKQAQDLRFLSGALGTLGLVSFIISRVQKWKAEVLMNFLGFLKARFNSLDMATIS